MNEVRFISFSKIPMRLIVNLYNTIYSDYYFSVNHNMNSFEEYLKELSADLELSQLIIVNDILVGLALVALEDKKAWISVFGIKKEYRKRGLGEAMLEQVVKGFKQSGAEKIGLEVLDFNLPANNLYKKHGFKLVSKLTCLEGRLGKTEHAKDKIVKLSYANIENHLEESNNQVWSRRKKRLSDNDIRWIGLIENNEVQCFMGYEQNEAIIVKIIKTLCDDSNILRRFFTSITSCKKFDREFCLINFLDNEQNIINIAKEFGLKQFLKQNLLILDIRND